MPKISDDNSQGKDRSETKSNSPGWFGNRSSDIYMSQGNSEYIFATYLNHEFIHSYHHLKIGANTPGYAKYSETSAYTNTKEFIPQYTVPINDGGYNGHPIKFWPTGLIPIQHPR